MVEDLKTFRKHEIDELITKYGPRRRFARTLVKWLRLHGFWIDLDLLKVCIFFDLIF